MRRATRPRSPRWIVASALLTTLIAATSYGSTFTNFESHQIHPLEISSDGARLFAVNTPDNRLTVYTITPQGLAIEKEIPVGLDPVSVRQRTADEVWVVNHLSDDVSVVSLATGNVRATLRVGDEPTDVVFAGAEGRAFVCVSQEDAVKIYDPDDLLAPAVVVSIFGSDPRALAANSDRTRVYVAIFEAGNRTSILGQNEVVAGGGPPPADPPRKASLPPPIDVGLVIRWTGAHWIDETATKNWETFVPIPYTLPDNDVAELDADAANPAPRYFTDVGTLNFNLTVNPSSGVVYVANTEAFNVTRFEPNLIGRFLQNRVTRVDPAGAGTVTPVHLNPHIDYADSVGNAGERALSLSQPNAGDWDSAGTNLYLAAVGSAKIAVVNPAGTVTARAAVGEGPTAVVVDDARGRLYVLERFANTIAILDKASLAVTGGASLGFQPEPAAVTAGRRFLYDAQALSAHGDLACASCHAFANFDNVAWDLGNPLGDLQPGPQGFPPFDPMKGPMTTQSLRGLADTGPFHWRGDRANFNRFNPAFKSLMGAPDTLSGADMQTYTDFIMTVVFPPNPNQNLDRTYPTAPPGQPSAERGRFEFVTNPHDGGLRCQDCHQSQPPNEPFRVSPGADRFLIPGPALQESQAFKIPHLRNLYEKTGFRDAAGPQKRGFGFVHDGNVDDLFAFLHLPVFQFPGGDPQRRDVEAFLHAFDTGMAPAIGYQVTVDAANKNVSQVVARIDTLMDQADAGNIDLVAKGIAGGVPRGYLYVGAGMFESDRSGEGPIAESALRASAGSGAELTFTGVPPGNGERIGVDRDGDTFLDRDEIDAGSNPADPSSTPATFVDGGWPGAARPGDGLRNTPNPVGRAGTEFSFTLPEPTLVSLRIFDVQGREVAVLLEKTRQQGTVTLRWDGRDRHGREVASGIYLYRLEAGSVVRSRNLVIVR